jgi:hypothetical protein
VCSANPGHSRTDNAIFQGKVEWMKRAARERPAM